MRIFFDTLEKRLGIITGRRNYDSIANRELLRNEIAIAVHCDTWGNNN